MVSLSKPEAIAWGQAASDNQQPMRCAKKHWPASPRPRVSCARKNRNPAGNPDIPWPENQTSPVGKPDFCQIECRKIRPHSPGKCPLPCRKNQPKVHMAMSTWLTFQRARACVEKPGCRSFEVRFNERRLGRAWFPASVSATKIQRRRNGAGAYLWNFPTRQRAFAREG